MYHKFICIYVYTHITLQTAISTCNEQSVSPLLKFLHQSGRQVVNIKGDGNCLFRSFALQLLGNQQEHFNVQSLLVRFKNSNAVHLESRLTSVNELTIRQHISMMSKPGCWGTHIEVIATASLYQVPVYYCTDPGPHSEKGHIWQAVHPIAQASNNY